MNAEKMERAIKRGVNKALFEQSFAIRTDAKNSIKRAPRVRRANKRRGIRGKDAISRPGDPPFYHRNRFYPSFIQYAVNREAMYAVIGPAKKTNKGVPRGLEKGGITTAKRKKRIVRQRIKARPHMVPAHHRQLPGFVYKFRGVVLP